MMKSKGVPMKRPAIVFAVLLSFVAVSRGEEITVATYNIELFHQHLSPTSQPISDRDLARRVRADADKDLWMISQVILDPKFHPDILCIEECCDQNELEKVNK